MIEPEFQPDNNGTVWVKRNEAGLYGHYRRTEFGGDKKWFWVLEGKALSGHHKAFQRTGFVDTEEEAKQALRVAMLARQYVVKAFSAEPEKTYHPDWEAASYMESDLICPYCGKTTSQSEGEDLFGMFPREFDFQDGQTTEVLCSECDKPFAATVFVSYSFSSDPIEKDPEEKP
jgi:uncharacterized Zn-finger protein